MTSITRVRTTPLSCLTVSTPDAPVVVLLHGVFDSAGCWVPIMEALADAGFRAVAMDLPGHGESPRAEGLSVTAMAEAVISTMDALEVGAATVIGHSMGGLVAQELALSFPDRVARLVLEDPAWEVVAHAGSAPAFLHDRAEQLKTWSPSRILADGRSSHPGWDERDLAGWFLAKFDVDPDLLCGPQDWIGLTGPSRWESYRGDILLLTAGGEGAVVTEEMVDAATDSLGGHLTHRHVAAAGHNIRKDAPAEFLGSVLTFIPAA